MKNIKPFIKKLLANIFGVAIGLLLSIAFLGFGVAFIFSYGVSFNALMAGDFLTSLFAFVCASLFLGVDWTIVEFVFTD